MPRPTAKGFPCNPEKCFGSRHLDGPDYKVYDVMCACAKPDETGKRFFYAPVRPWLVNAVNQSPSAVDATLNRLEAAGWILNSGRDRRSDGTETPNRYEIVEHQEWVSTHPGCCPDYRLAPNEDEAQRYGLNKGERLSSGLPLPKNFWPKEPILRNALEKVTSEEGASLITDEEMAALNEHLTKIVVVAATPGTPGEAPLPVNEEPLPVHREESYKGILHKQPPQPTPGQPVGGRGSCETNPLAETPSDSAEKTFARMREIFFATEARPLEFGKWKPALFDLIRKHGCDAVVDAFTSASNSGNCWDSQTQMPCRRFVENFDSYLFAAKQRAGRKQLNVEDIKRAGEASLAAREQLWADEPKSKEPGPEEF